MGRWIVAAPLVAALAAGCGSPAAADSAPRPAAQKPGDGRYVETRRVVTELAHEAMRAHRVTGVSVALVDGREVVWAEGFGHADREAGIAASAATRYRAGSLAKVVVALALLRLSERGLLELDAPLRRLLPDLELGSSHPDAPPITVRQVMAHQSGLPSDHLRGMWDPTPTPWRELVAELRGVDVPYPPRYVTTYSNVGYALLGAVIERVAGEPLEQHLHEQVLAPLAMHGASFSADGPSLARPYRLDEPATEPVMRLTPAGGLIASVTDIAQLIKLVFARGRVDDVEIVSNASIAQMLRPHNADMPLDLDLRVGLPWLLTRVELAYAGPVAWQLSWTPHFHGQLMLLPEHELGVVVLSNSFTGARVVDPIAVEALQSALQEKAGLDLPDPVGATPAPRPLAPPELRRHVGRYATDQSTLTIELVDGVLRSQSLAGHAELEPLADGTFDVRGIPGLRLSFERIADRELIVTHQHGVRGYLAERIEPMPIPAAWRERLGALELTNAGDDFPVLANPHLREDGGLLVLGYDFLLPHPTIPVSMVLEPTSDDHARIVGLGRGKGESVRAARTPDGERIRWSGYELRRRGGD